MTWCRAATEGVRPGFRVEDAMVNYARSAIAWNVLEGLGVGGVTDLWMSQVSNGTNIAVHIHKACRGPAQQVAAAPWGTSGSLAGLVVASQQDATSESDQISVRPGR
jgi:3-polyprenyl-4-hydroxybenzoate decarboxylase